MENASPIKSDRISPFYECALLHHNNMGDNENLHLKSFQHFADKKGKTKIEEIKYLIVP